MEATQTSCRKDYSNELETDVTCNGHANEESTTLAKDEKPLQECADTEASQPRAEGDGHQETLGPWVTGQPVYTSGGEITGIRPVVDRYSVTQHGLSEWSKHNDVLLQNLRDKIRNSELTRRDGKYSVVNARKDLDEVKSVSTRQLQTRANEIRVMKKSLADAIKSIDEEIKLLEAEGRRVRSTLSVLNVPESIAGEFLQIRTTRLEPDLVYDGVEEELIKEVALCYETREVLSKVRGQIDTQLMELRHTKMLMESDWSDKSDAHAIESTNIRLTTDSPLIMWKPGTVRVTEEQSTVGYYEHYTSEILATGETVIKKSAELRSTLSHIYEQSIKNLRERATRVDIVLTQHVDLTEEILRKLEKDLLKCLGELGNMDKLIEELRRSTVIFDRQMKMVQTRLSNRLQRPNVEDCRDFAQLALHDEVKVIGERQAAISAELNRAKDVQHDLTQLRSQLEKQIIVKRRSLYVDKQRGTWLRSMYPPAAALSGY